jgi:ubiquinone/menaquinone biosynthesis C-methylase UbiE
VAHKFDPAHRARLESPERLALLDPERIVSLAGVQEGERVLDAGCGTGIFTVLLARAVGDGGRVYAADIEPEMLEECRARVAAAGRSNVTLTRSEESAVPLPAACVDLVFTCQLLHELHDPPAFLAEVQRLLAPGGRFVAVDWEKTETGMGPPLDKRLDRIEARAMLEAGGLRVEREETVTWANYLLIARPA